MAGSSGMQEQGTLMAARKPNTWSNKAAYGLIVAGGSGTRLWPLSRADTPKQLLTLGDGPHTLVQNTFLRLSRSIDPRRIKVVTNLNHTSHFAYRNNIRTFSNITNRFYFGIFLSISRCF